MNEPADLESISETDNERMANSSQHISFCTRMFDLSLFNHKLFLEDFHCIQNTIIALATKKNLNGKTKTERNKRTEGKEEGRWKRQASRMVLALLRFF